MIIIGINDSLPKTTCQYWLKFSLITLEKNCFKPPCLLRIKMVPETAIKNNKKEHNPTKKRPILFKNKDL